jgi:hypothetical protein
MLTPNGPIEKIYIDPFSYVAMIKDTIKRTEIQITKYVPLIAYLPFKHELGLFGRQDCVDFIDEETTMEEFRERNFTYMLILLEHLEDELSSLSSYDIIA